ncbi:MAG: cytosine permease [Ferroplasma sp.]
MPDIKNESRVTENGLEVIGVNPIPNGERTMSSRKIFIFWSMASASALTPIVGLELYNMGLANEIIAIFIALLIGLIPAGLVAEMGRQFPVTALVVARKTYGYMTSGAYSLIFTFLNLGFFGLNDTVGAEIISSLTHSNIILWYVIMGAIQIILVLYGAKWLEYFFRYSAPVLLLSYAVLTYFLLTSYKINLAALANPIGPFYWGTTIDFLLGFSILAWSYKISTQTRFGIPFKNARSPIQRLGYFISSPFGIMLPVFLMGIIGLIGNSIEPGTGWNIAILPFAHLHGLLGVVVFIAALGVSLAIIHTNAMNLYPATADLLASIQPAFKKKSAEKLAQPIGTVALGVGGIILAIAGILAHIEDFIDLLADIIFPFTFILIFDWFMNLRYTTKLSDYYKIPKSVYNNLRLDALVPAIIGTLIGMLGIGPYDYIFHYFPQAIFGSLIGLGIFVAIFYAGQKTGKKAIKNDGEYANFETE